MNIKVNNIIYGLKSDYSNLNIIKEVNDCEVFYKFIGGREISSLKIELYRFLYSRKYLASRVFLLITEKS